MTSAETATNAPITQRYRLDFEEKTCHLVGVVEPPPPPPDDDDEPKRFTPPITLRSLHEHLKEAGFADYFYLTNSVELFLKKIQRFENGRYVLAERRDAKISISLSHDKSTARAQTDKAWGGQRLTPELIEAEIHKAKLDPDTIDSKILEQLTTSDEAVDLILAKGVPPKNGRNAEIIQLLSSKKNADRRADSSEAIDQHDVFEFVVVDPGTELMKKIPATAGEDGKDVQGKKIRAIPGTDMQFSKPYEGVEPNDEDENLLVATIKGHPVFNKFGVKVDALMALDAVDIHSGDINYDGSLLVKHNIEAGFEVTVSGDVFVKGSITKATIKAGGSIMVTGGVNADDIDDEHGCHLEALGDVSAKFFHHTNIHCNGDLHAHEYIMQCRISAEGYVNAGQERGRGCIIGGHCTSNSGIHAKVLGSEAYVPTNLTLGSDSALQRAVAKLEEKLKRRVQEESQLSRILIKVQATGTPTNLGRTTLDKARKIENTVELLRTNISNMETQLTEMKSRLTVTDELLVKVSDRIFPNVIISISGHSWSCEETQRRCQFKLHGERIERTDYQQ